MIWQWWWRDFNAQWCRRSESRAIPADYKNTRVYLDLRVGGWLMMWEGSLNVTQDELWKLPKILSSKKRQLESDLQEEF